jgi:broad specificity phosphatase PhoE
MSHDAWVYLVRHGRTAGNGRCYVGWNDLPLDEVGVSQALAAGRALAGRRVDALHASSLQRAIATAMAVRTGRGCGALPELEIHTALRELHYGEHAGRAKDELRLRLRRDHQQQPLPGGESLADVDRRSRAYLVQSLLPTLRYGRSIVVVAHFWSLRLLLAALRGEDFTQALVARDYKPANGSVLALPMSFDGDDATLPARSGPPHWLLSGEVPGEAAVPEPTPVLANLVQ